MLGKRGPQRGLFEADTAYGAFVGRDSFSGWLASQRGALFRDAEFAGLYVVNNGRPSVPPSLLATALVLQTYDGVSDEEAKQRAAYDLRWKVALGVELDARLVQLGIRQARYVGRARTEFQLLMAAAVANLTLLAHTPTADAHAVTVALVAVAMLWLTHRALHSDLERPAPDRWLATSPLAAVGPASATSSGRSSKSAGCRPDF